MKDDEKKDTEKGPQSTVKSASSSTTTTHRGNEMTTTSGDKSHMDSTHQRPVNNTIEKDTGSDLGPSTDNFESTEISEIQTLSKRPVKPLAVESTLDGGATRGLAISSAPIELLEQRDLSHSNTKSAEETELHPEQTKRKQSVSDERTGSLPMKVVVQTSISSEGSDRDTVDLPPNKPLNAGPSAVATPVWPSSHKSQGTVSTTGYVSSTVEAFLPTTTEFASNNAQIDPLNDAPNVKASLSVDTEKTNSRDPSTVSIPEQSRLSDSAFLAHSDSVSPNSLLRVASDNPAKVILANVAGTKINPTVPTLTLEKSRTSQPVGASQPAKTVTGCTFVPSEKTAAVDDVSTVALSNTLQQPRVPAVSFQQAIQQAANEEAIALARAPLAELYGSFLCHSTDSSLDDARNRLKNAIAQTRELRQTFTDRVYSKYRVFLRAPLTTDEIIANIQADPAGQIRKLKEETVTMREEKEIEKKEATKLNNEMSQSGGSERIPVLLNIDNAEQLMFFTAGLNLVILPEEQRDSQLLREQSDPSPVNHLSLQRARSISQAAASAGDVILDRTRKAAAMRVERQRRRQLQLLRGEVVNDGEPEINYSRLQVLSIAGSTSQHVPASKAAKIASLVGTKQSVVSLRRVPPTTGKAGRTRAQASLPSTILLSLNPTADEVKLESKPFAATLALISRGVGPVASNTTQQRLRHPHPESLGGRRRATMNPAKRDDDNSSLPPGPFLQSYLANTLPPLPAAKDRTERKALLVAQPNNESSERALRSLQSVLGQFMESDKGHSLHAVSKICLMNGLRKVNRNPEAIPVRQTEPSVPEENSADTVSPIHPSITMSALFALGIIDQSQPGSKNKSFSIPDINNNNTGFMSPKLRALKGKVTVNEQTTTESICGLKPPKVAPSKRTRSGGTVEDSPSKKTRCEDPSVFVSADSIRGGGGTSHNGSGVNEQSNSGQADTTAPMNVPASSEQKKRKHSESSSGRPSVESVPQPSSDQLQPTMLSETTQMAFLSSQLGNEPFHSNSSVNAFHLANQLHHLHHPAAGDLAEYLGSLQQQQQGFDIAALMTGATQSQFTPLGFLHQNPSLVGYTLQDRASAARAMLVREQQAAAILGRYQTQASGFAPVGSQHVAFLGGNVSSSLGGQQETVEDTSRQSNLQAETHETRVIQSGQTKEVKVASDQSMIVDVALTQKLAGDSATLKKHVAINPVEEQLSRRDEENDRKPSATVQKSTSQVSRGMAFVSPATPPSLNVSKADQIRSSNFHLVAAILDQSEYCVSLDFLLAVGAAVPIPKGLITAPLKERLNTPGFKSAGVNSAPQISREVIASVILIWLWTKHENIFQVAFEKNGRIDVDPECKWLIQTAVDTAVGELSLEIAESMARGEGAFAEASAARKASPQGTDTTNVESSYFMASKKLDLRTASIVCGALSVEMCIEETTNSVIPKYAQLIEYLDEARLGALRAKSQERVLLATLIARTAIMTENFAQAYVSAMVRAGEALGHGRLFEVVQDEGVASSTMIPYDIFTDESGAWEDPCKLEECFAPMMTGDDLMRRAHARAMIQKSLRKMQDRNLIRGGTPNFGPFVDPPGCGDSASGHVHDGNELAPNSSPRPSKRRMVLMNERRMAIMSEPRLGPGSGSAATKSWTVYNPKHSCSPLEWDPDELENCPYGLHPRGDRVRAIAVAPGRNGHVANLTKAHRSLSLSVVQDDTAEKLDLNRRLLPSTLEIDWTEVANTFHSVEVPKKASRYRPVEPEKPAAVDGIIFAPSCRQLVGELARDDTESDTEEELTDEAILASHQIVLDDMKAKLEAFLEARKKQQERRKNKQAK